MSKRKLPAWLERDTWTPERQKQLDNDFSASLLLPRKRKRKPAPNVGKAHKKGSKK